MSDTLIRLEGVSRVFDGKPPVRALHDVDLTVTAGESIAVLGRSGSGKSTLLHILGLLDRPTSGRYWFDGIDVEDLGDDRRSGLRGRRMGFVFQDFHLLRHRTVTENVVTALLYNRFPRRRRKEAARRALERVGLGSRMNAAAETLSGGESQRVAIARAIASEPSVLLADEPTGNLDSQTTESILEVFDDLRRGGLTLVVVTHDPHVAAVAERRITLADGALEPLSVAGSRR